jgi:hypothetical protein
VAQTIAQYAADQKLLGASFFFSRAEHERKTGNKFFSTLAFQLALHDPHLGSHVASALLVSPDLPWKALEQQFQSLVLGPIQQAQSTHPVILVIDAMDECLSAQASIILHLLAHNIQSMTNIKIFVTTRPGVHMETILSDHNLLQPIYLRLCELEKSVVKGDIQLFLAHALLEGEADTVPQSNQWEPTMDELDILSDKFGILFIMATTAVQYMLGGTNDPEALMNQLLGTLDDQEEDKEIMSFLDKMYLEILRSSLPEEASDEAVYLRAFKQIVGTIVILEDPLPLSAFANFLQMGELDVQITLQYLHSILAPTSSNQALQIYHKSFPDFITNNKCCTDARFYIVPEECHAQAAQCCFTVMNEKLHTNMYNLQGLQKFMKNSEIRELGNYKIVDEVAYACMHWATHLSKAGDSNTNEFLLEMLGNFAYQHLLHWIEVLSLIGKLEMADPAMKLAQDVLVRVLV